MAIRGPRPGSKPRANAPQWREYPNTPYEGDRPELPATRALLDEGVVVQVPVHPWTVRWWEAVSRMPHCRDWCPGEWEYALSTAMVADMFHRTSKMVFATELRHREKDPGTTFGARLGLRIRYVDPEDQAKSSKPRLLVVDDYSDL